MLLFGCLSELGAGYDMQNNPSYGVDEPSSSKTNHHRTFVQDACYGSSPYHDNNSKATWKPSSRIYAAERMDLPGHSSGISSECFIFAC